MKNNFPILLFCFFFLSYSSLSAQGLKRIFSKSEAWAFQKDQEALLKQNIRQDIQFLSSFQLEGRKAGELGAKNAALYIQDRLEKMNVSTLNLPNKFKVSTGKRLTANTRLTINNFLVRIPEEARPLPFSNSDIYQGYFLIGNKEPLTPWVLPIFDSREEAHELKDGWVDKAFKMAEHAQRLDAEALFLFDPYGVVNLETMQNAGHPELDIPVVMLSSKVYDKHLKSLKSLTSINLQLEFSRIEKETENVYAFIHHNSDKTILLSASYDYLGAYYDSNLPYGNNKVVHYGADQNASGVAGALALVNMLQMKNTLGNNYNYIIAFYSGSQSNHQGVKHFLEFLPDIMKRQVVTAIHLDHIGRYQPENGLYVMGSNQSGMYDKLANRSTSRMNIHVGGNISRNSDAYVYDTENIPTLQFHTGLLEDHGKSADHPSKINYLYVWNIVHSIYQGLFSAEPSLQLDNTADAKPAQSVNIIKRTIEWEEWGMQIDKSYEGFGVKLLSLSDDGIAQKIDLQAGDIIFNINKKPVVTLADLEAVLKTIKYDENILIKIKREVSVLDIDVRI